MVFNRSPGSRAVKRWPTATQAGGVQTNALLDTVEPFACAAASGAVSVTPVPVGPAVPTVATVAVSAVAPVRIVIWPFGSKFTLVPVTALTLITWSPAAEAATSVVEIGRMYGPPP